MDCVIVFTENDQMIFFIKTFKFLLLRQLVVHLQFTHKVISKQKNVFESREEQSTKYCYFSGFGIRHGATCSAQNIKFSVTQ